LKTGQEKFGTKPVSVFGAISSRCVIGINLDTRSKVLNFPAQWNAAL